MKKTFWQTNESIIKWVFQGVNVETGSLRCPPAIWTFWGRVTYICVGTLTSISADNGWSPGWHQAIIWTNAVIMLIGPLKTTFSDILIEIHTFSFEKMYLKISFGRWWPFYLASNVLAIFCSWSYHPEGCEKIASYQTIRTHNRT